MRKVHWVNQFGHRSLINGRWGRLKSYCSIFGLDCCLTFRPGLPGLPVGPFWPLSPCSNSFTLKKYKMVCGRRTKCLTLTNRYPFFLPTKNQGRSLTCWRTEIENSKQRSADLRGWTNSFLRRYCTSAAKWAAYETSFFYSLEKVVSYNFCRSLDPSTLKDVEPGCLVSFWF